MLRDWPASIASYPPVILVTMRKPAALKPGDRIEIVSPSSAITFEKMSRGIELLKTWGYEVTLAPHALDHKDYLAGSDEHRAADLQAAFDNPDVSAVFCSRGGYGCARLFPYLDLDRMAASNKPFFGFSDITTLHLALNKRGLMTYHAPMLLTLSREREPWVETSLRDALAGSDPLHPDSKAGKSIVPGSARGRLTGGCLCLITDSIGTPYAIETEGRIVLIEDVDENPHRVDAMLTQMLNTGHAQAAAGFVIGEMTGTDDRQDASIGKRPWREIVADRLAPLGKPMIVEYPFGHNSAMLTLPMGAMVKLDADAGRLSLLEDA